MADSGVSPMEIRHISEELSKQTRKCIQVLERNRIKEIGKPLYKLNIELNHEKKNYVDFCGVSHITQMEMNVNAYRIAEKVFLDKYITDKGYILPMTELRENKKLKELNATISIDDNIASLLKIDAMMKDVNFGGYNLDNKIKLNYRNSEHVVDFDNTINRRMRYPYITELRREDI